MFAHDFQGMAKKDLRTLLKTEVLSPEILSEEISSLQKNLNVFLARQSGCWGAFAPIHPEPIIEPSLQIAKHIEWVYPRVENVDQSILEFYSAEPHEFERGAFEISQPLKNQSNHKPLSSLAGVLVPALGFDIYGRRLGRGKGFYDRLLQNWNGIKVGIAFRSQILAELPEEAHDIKMDYLVTSAGVIQCGQQQFHSKVRGS